MSLMTAFRTVVYVEFGGIFYHKYSKEPPKHILIMKAPILLVMPQTLSR